jgi:type IV pilus assembly protein PilW
MSMQHTSSRRRARGFTLVELMVTVAIAMFLLAGLVTIVQNVRLTYASQQGLAQLQDTQRFTMGIITDIVQQGGYFPDPTANTPASALTGIAPYAGGQAFFGTPGTAAVSDIINVRFVLKQIQGTVVDGILCDGSTNWGAGATLYVNTFRVLKPAGGLPGQLQCSVNGAAWRTIVNGVEDMQILYGVKRTATSDYNVDTYLLVNQMVSVGSGGPNGGNDWANISAVRIRLVFTNPLFGQAGQPNPTIIFERVIEVMGRAGVHT